MPEGARRNLLAQLQRAASLPRGEFLEGFALRDAPAFDDWVRFQREYWHLRTSEVFDHLSQMQFEAGELEVAIETANRWLVLAPLHEEAYRRLMRLYFAAGDRVAALHAYDTCRTRLSDTWLAELARLLPELCDRYPDLSDPGGDKSVARNRLFEAVARLSQALAARAPLVLFVDDVQWADAASRDVLHYLARRFAESEKARAIYTSMLAYAQDVSQSVMESTAFNHLAALAAQ